MKRTAIRKRSAPLQRTKPLARTARLRARQTLKRGRVAVSLRTKDRKKLERELDRLCRELVFRRDGFTCQKTGKKENLQWAHIHTRGIKGLRWRPENALCLSAGAHLWWHLHPTEGVKWFTEKWPERAALLELIRASRTKQRLDLEATRLWLVQQLERA